MARILDGKVVAEHVYAGLKSEMEAFSSQAKLVVVLVGEDPASQTYVRNKEKRCHLLGLGGETLTLPETVSKEKLLATVQELNEDPCVCGILVQLPLPKHIDKYRVIRAIDPLKDVDGLHPENVGLLALGRSRFLPCTPAGIIEVLQYYKVPLQGERVVIVGRSDIVGKPMIQLMLAQNATVTVCHSRTKELGKVTAGADILVAAIGQPKFFGASMVKEGATVIDVGMHRVDGKLVGDVDFQAVESKVANITPVPGGVGPMTIAMLMKNVALAAKGF